MYVYLISFHYTFYYVGCGAATAQAMSSISTQGDKLIFIFLVTRQSVTLNFVTEHAMSRIYEQKVENGLVTISTLVLCCMRDTA